MHLVACLVLRACWVGGADGWIVAHEWRVAWVWHVCIRELQLHSNAITGTIPMWLSVPTQLEYVQGSLALLCVLLSLHFQVKQAHT
jgi:hypothetical protein